MGCFYIYTDGSNNLDSSVLRELPSGNNVLTATGKQINVVKSESLSELRDLIWQKTEFIRYNSSYTSDTRNKLIEIHNEGEKFRKKSNTAVTKIADSIAYNGKYWPAPTGIDTIFKDVMAEFGSKFHNCMDGYISKGDAGLDEAIDEFIKFLTKDGNIVGTNKFNLSDSVIDELINHTNDNYKAVGKFLKNIQNDTTGTYKTNLINSLRLAVQQLKNSEYIKGKEVLSEITIAANKESAIPVVGRIDLVAFDGDQNFYILDFKTSAGIKQMTPYSYAQLLLYKSALQQNGISWQDCTLVNVNFQLHEDGSIEFHGFNGEETLAKHINMSSKIAIQREIDSNIHPTVTAISEEEQRKRLGVGDKVNEGLFNSEFLNKQTPKIYQQFVIQKAKDKKQIWIQKNRRACDIILSSDEKTITILAPDKTKIYDNVPIEDFVNQELKLIEDNKHIVVRSYIEALKNKNKQGLQNLVSKNTSSSINSLQAHLGKYMNARWQYRENKALEQRGIISMYDRSTNTVDFIMLTTDQDFNGLYKLSTDYKTVDKNGNEKKNKSEGNKILDDVFSDEAKKKYVGYETLPQATVGNVQVMRALAYISQCMDLYPEGTKIGNVKAVSTVNGTGTFNIGYQGFDTTFKMLQAEANRSGNRLTTPEFRIIGDAIDKLNFTSFEQQGMNMIMDGIMSLDVNVVDSSHWDEWNLYRKIDWLNAVENQIKTQYRSAVEVSSKADYSKEAQQLIGVIQQVKANLQDMLFTYLPNITKYGITLADSTGVMFNILVHGNASKYTSDNFLISGLLQSLESSVSYSSPDEYGRRVALSIDNFFTQIRKQYLEEITEVNNATMEWLDYIRDNLFGGVLTDAVFGHHNPYYKNLFAIDPSNPSELDQNFRFKNPYVDNLAEHDSKYLKVILWNINRKRIRKSDGLTDAQRKLTYAQLEKNQEALNKYKQLLTSDSRWLNVPLKRSTGVNNFIQGVDSLIKGKKKLNEFWEGELEKWKEHINPQRLTPYQREQKKEKIDRLEAFNSYAEREEDRVRRIQESIPEDYVWNLNYLCNDFTLQYITHDIQKKLLNTIDTQVGCLRMYELLTGQNCEDKIEAILKRTKISIYNENLIPDELRDFAALIGVGKELGSLTKIAVRPMLYLKEMTVGTLKNISVIASDYIKGPNKITFNDLMSAASEVYGEGLIDENLGMFTGSLKLGDFGKIGLLNNEYAITDRDMNIMSERTSVDRYGIVNQGARSLYYNTVRPDWFNRMTIFVAKMKADGCWDAYSKDPKTGKLVYDMSKDKRFTEFWQHRNDKNYTSPTFEKQKALYLVMMQEFASPEVNLTNSDGTPLRFGRAGIDVDARGNLIYDPLPMAYTPRERDSIKEQIGLLYGFYDHEEKAIGQNSVWYYLYTQFLTFVPGEVQKWFAVGRETSVGEYLHVKDPITGKPLYYKTDKYGIKTKVTGELDSNGNAIPPKDENGKNLPPVVEWSGHPVEGLLISLGKSAHDICTLDFQHLKENPDQLKNAGLALFNILFGSLFGWIMLMLLTGGSGDKKELSQAAYLSYDLATKVGRELNFYNNIIDPALNLGIVGQNYWADMVGDTYKAITNDNYTAINTLYDNLAILKDTRFMDYID